MVKEEPRAQSWNPTERPKANQRHAIKGKSGICATALNRCQRPAHITEPKQPLTSVPPSPCPFHNHHQRVHLKLLRYCAPKRHVLQFFFLLLTSAFLQTFYVSGSVNLGEAPVLLDTPTTQRPQKKKKNDLYIYFYISGAHAEK